MRWHAVKLRYKYISRRLRAVLMRCFLRLLMLLFSLEERLRPIAADHRKKILIIVIGGLGDCLLFDPLFRRLKEKWPDCRIDILTGCFEGLWERIESIDHLIYFRPSRLKSPWKYAGLFRTIYRNRYDIVAEGIAMVPPRGIYPIFTSLVFTVSRAPIRIGRMNTGRLPAMRPGSMGFTQATAIPPTGARWPANQPLPSNPYVTHILDLLPPDQRSYHESAKIFEPLGLQYTRKKDEPRLAGHPQLDRWAHALVRQQWAAEQDRVVGFTIETTRRIKAWPLENFIKVLKWALAEQFKFIMLGLQTNPSENPFRRLAGQDLLDLTGKTSLGEMISVIRQCDLFLSCDTGPAHIAQALQVPTIVLFGPSNEAEFGPYERERHSLILPAGHFGCRPCVLGPCIRGKSCIHEIDPKTVFGELSRKAAGLQKQGHASEVEPHQPPRVLCSI